MTFGDVIGCRRRLIGLVVRSAAVGGDFGSFSAFDFGSFVLASAKHFEGGGYSRCGWEFVQAFCFFGFGFSVLSAGFLHWFRVVCGSVFVYSVGRAVCASCLEQGEFLASFVWRCCG